MFTKFVIHILQILMNVLQIMEVVMGTRLVSIMLEVTIAPVAMDLQEMAQIAETSMNVWMLVYIVIKMPTVQTIMAHMNVIAYLDIRVMAHIVKISTNVRTQP